MGIEAVFFDLGDTIVDLREGQTDYQMRLEARAGTIYDLLHAAGLALPERAPFCAALAEGSEGAYQAALAQQLGIDIRTVLSALFAQQGIVVEERMLEASVDTYCGGASVETMAPLRQGAETLLAQLQGAGLRLGVISNTLQPGHYMDRSLARRALLRHFAARAYSSDVGVAKPHPGIFQAALARLGVPAGRAVHVGDRLIADVYGAQRAGMKGVLIRVAHRLENDPAITPDAVIDELSALPGVLEELGA